MSFPLNSNDPYIKPTGERSTLGAEIGSGGGGGGGGSYTPDYEHEILIIGENGDFEYYIPMNKRYIGDGIMGYEIKTNPDSDNYDAKIDIYSIAYDDNEIVYRDFIITVHHDSKNGATTYSDDSISVAYSGGWVVTLKETMYETDGDAYTSPLTWTYNTTVDYVMLTENPVST